MHSAYIALAHGRGLVRVTPDYQDAHYLVEHFTGWVHPRDIGVIRGDVELVKSTTIEKIEGEPVKDTKARAIAAVKMLMHWPSMLAEFAQDARLRSAIAGTLATPTARPTTPGGLIFPPGVSR